jgi:hypothetical protein
LIGLRKDFIRHEENQSKLIQLLVVLNFVRSENDDESKLLVSKLLKVEYIGNLLVGVFNEICGKDHDIESAFILTFHQILNLNSPSIVIDSNDFGVLFGIILRRIQRTDSNDTVIYFLFFSMMTEIFKKIACKYLKLLEKCIIYDSHLTVNSKHLYDQIIEICKMIINEEKTLPEIRTCAFDLLKLDILLL